MFTEIGNRIRIQSENAWGRQGMVFLIGESASISEAQERAARYAEIVSPVLITGESGVGKELFARSIYLLSDRCGGPFVSVNCAQYQNDDLLVSELFGHRKGSFTGAVSDRQGLFQAADGGVLFLDEVGELSHRAQAMLLRVLSEGEVKPLGHTEIRRVNVRVIAATNRPLRAMVEDGTFRADLYYRLRYLQLGIPPIRDRQNDWRLLVSFYLNQAARAYGGSKRLAHDSWKLLERHVWPGNVREIRSVVDVGYCLSTGERIGPECLTDLLATECEMTRSTNHHHSSVQSALSRMMEEDATFWDAVREPFLDRELNRAEVQEIVASGLRESGWSYKAVLDLFNLAPDEYLRFMDFLRHHRLKPAQAGSRPGSARFHRAN